MTKTIKGRVQHPAYTAAELKAKNPVLLKGEVVYETDTTLHKVGDGVTPWNALEYAGGGFKDGIPADQINQDATHRFVTDAEKSVWNDKAAKDLSNVSIGKQFAGNGYYKAPDGLLIQWGKTVASNDNGGVKLFFPISFYGTPFSCFVTFNSGAETTPLLLSAHIETLSSTSVAFRESYMYQHSDKVYFSKTSFFWLAVGRWK